MDCDYNEQFKREAAEDRRKTRAAPIEVRKAEWEKARDKRLAQRCRNELDLCKGFSSSPKGRPQGGRSLWHVRGDVG